MVVKAVVKVAVKMEQMQIPIRIQKMEKSRPKIDLGALSPYLKSNMDGYRQWTGRVIRPVLISFKSFNTNHSPYGCHGNKSPPKAFP
jgi:hypothetical protein